MERIINDIDIAEGRKLIADMMDWRLICLNPNDEDGDENKLYEFHRYENGEVVELNCGGDSWSWGKGGTLPFNKSWDWFMAAYKKYTEILEKMRVDLNIPRNAASQGDLHDVNISCHVREFNLEQAFAHLVEAVKWHNKQSIK